jgi:hypothetical protein
LTCEGAKKGYPEKRAIVLEATQGTVSVLGRLQHEFPLASNAVLARPDARTLTNILPLSPGFFQALALLISGIFR